MIPAWRDPLLPLVLAALAVIGGGPVLGLWLALSTFNPLWLLLCGTLILLED